MPTKIYNEINNFVIKAKKLLGDRLKKIILYGSYARGDYNTNSDIDIMLLTDLSDDEIVKYRQILWDYVADIEIDYGIILNPLLKNVNDFNELVDVTPFYQNVINEGVVIGEEKR